MSDEELVVVCTVTNPVEAEIIKAHLEAEGVRCFIENEGQAALSGVLSIRLFVAKSAIETAKELIASHDVLKEGEYPSEAPEDAIKDLDDDAP